LGQNGDRVEGQIARMGVTIIEVSGHLAETLEITERRDPDRLLLASSYPAPTGRDSITTRPSSTVTAPSRPGHSRKVNGEVILRESRFDPVVDLPVREPRNIVFAERSSVQRAEIHGMVPAEWIRPYAPPSATTTSSPMGEE